MTDQERLRAALQAFVTWDDEHEGIYSEHNPAVRRMIAEAKAALARIEQATADIKQSCIALDKNLMQARYELTICQREQAQAVAEARLTELHWAAEHVCSGCMQHVKEEGGWHYYNVGLPTGTYQRECSAVLIKHRIAELDHQLADLRAQGENGKG